MYKSGEFVEKEIVFMVDCHPVAEFSTYSLIAAEDYHKYLKKHGCTYLSDESPVVNASQIILHYTSTTYEDWCNLI